MSVEFTSLKKREPMNSKELFERSKNVAPGGVHSPVRAFRSVGGDPMFFKAGQGAYLESVEGRKYLDYCMSFGPLILGHRDPFVQSKVEEMIRTAWSFGTCEPYSLALAEKIKTWVPHIEKLRFVASGTEAVMSLIRVARAATGRKYVLKFNGCYHGHVDSMLVKSGSGMAGEASSDSAGVSSETARETLVAELDREEDVERIFKERGFEIAAVMIEPVPANYGLLPQRPEFLKFLREITTKYGSLLVFDEVISGFRVAKAGMTEISGVTPDLSAYGKVLGGGFNVACYGGPAKYMDWVAPSGPVYQAGTLSANPVGMTAGLASLEKVEALGGLSVLHQNTASFAKKLQTLFDSMDWDLQVTEYRSLFWFHQRCEKPIRSLGQIPPTQKESFAQLFHALIEQGVYMAPSGFEVGFMSFAHTEEVQQKTLDAFQKAGQKLR